MLWLYDSRDRMHGKRKLYVLPHTSEGKLNAWLIVLTAEVPNDMDDYRYLADSDAEDMNLGGGELFNDYWAEYGWYLMPVEPDAEVPPDAEEVKQ